MANDILRFAILGLGAGAVYAVTALGVVLVYRGSGVVNFAHGAIGMVGAFIFYNQRESGTATPVAWVLALGFGALLGAGIHLLVMRPLRRAPAISRLVATLGIFAILFAWAHQRYGDSPRIVAKLLPLEDVVEVLPDITIGEDRVILLAIGVALTVVLTLVYRFTRFGLATSAVAESRRATSALGISPDIVATVNWSLGSMLAVLAAVLVVNIAGLSVIGLTLLIVPALAAALVGGFRSFPLTLLGGLLIGVLQSEIAWLQTYLTQQEGHVVTLDGWADSVPFLVIIVVLVVLGRSLPLRGDASERPPEVGAGRIRPVVLVPVVAVGVLLVSVVFSTTVVEAVTTSAAFGIVVLSLVVVTGFTGQLSLAEFALAGIGGWIAAALVANEGAPFWLAAACGVLGAVPVGVLVGLPSLRTRGVNLAVATLGLAVVIQAWVLGNAERTGGITGLDIGVPDVFGLDVDPLHHPQRYAVLALLLLVVAAVLVANLRRGRAGRRLVAVRSNERAAAALGISVFGAKLYAFGLSAAIAGIGGVLIVFRRPTAVFLPTFSIFESIFVVIYAVIGGIGFVLGSAIGGAIAPGAFATSLFGDVFNDTESVQVALGFVLLAVLLLVPDGLASLPGRVANAARSRTGRPVTRRTVLPEDVPWEPVQPTTLELRDVSVRFGGVVALDSVSITVRPGEVVGLIGPNGAGKTTCIDAATGFVRSTGEILLDGVRVDRWSPRRRAVAGIGRSFQTLELFESLTVLENLRTASEPRDRRAYLTDLVWPRRAELAPTAVAAVREFGLEPDLDRRPDELPYGRRRLVAIARAVAAESSVLLLDEPAAGLSDDETAELGGLIRRLADDWGLAVLLVEHDVGLVLDVCDRVVVLDEGRHLAEGPPEEVRRTPTVIAAYLGQPVEQPPSEVPAPAVIEATTGKTPSDECLVSARGLAAGYGDLAAVRDLDLEVRAGEIVALLGPNGAGKTTTLLTIAGELAPLAGEVRCLDLSGRAPLHRRVRHGLAFVPEERAVFSSLSVAGNLRLRAGATAEATELFPELTPLLRRRAGLLSGGEQQMLTLGRALAGTPRLLLVDELSLGLAPLVVQRLLHSVRAAADAGVGVLLVEQHASEALSVADRVVVLRRGRVALEGSAADLRADVGELESAYLSGLDDEPMILDHDEKSITMDDRDLAFTPALEQAAMLRRGEISSAELVERYLARIERLNPAINAYVTVAADLARAVARDADAALREGMSADALAPFLGVPISIKDLHDTAGIRTTHGTAEWHDRVPEHDDEVVARCRRGGFVFLGKTIVPEFGPLNISEPPAYPPGRNPWDPERSCGGSSGGAAAAVVAGLCAVSHGSDGGGSIRNPSSWCGAVGIKPQRGRVSAAPDSQQFFSISGPIARNVADAAALLDVMAGPTTGDAWWAPPFERPLVEEVGRDPGRLRVAYHAHPGVDAAACAPANRAAAEDAARLLESLGHEVEEIAPPGYAEDVVVASATIFAAQHAAAADQVPYPPLETLDPWMRTLVEMGGLVGAVDFVKAFDALEAMSRRTVAFFDEHDVFVSPTVAAPPPVVGSMADAGIERMMEFWALTPFTALWNTTGQPAAVSLPLATDDAGLPVGVQVVGRPAAEATLVRIATVLESERPWIGRRPLVS